MTAHARARAGGGVRAGGAEVGGGQLSALKDARQLEILLEARGRGSGWWGKGYLNQKICLSLLNTYLFL